MRKFGKSIAVGAGLCLAAVLLAVGAAQAQFDPFAATAPRPAPTGPGAAPAAPSAAAILAPTPAAAVPGMRTGFLSVEQAVGASYAAANTKGVVSMAMLKTLPRTVAPIPIQLKASGARQLAAKPRIAIPTYTLALIEQGSVRGSGAGAGSDITPRATTINTVLMGVSDELGAQLVDEGYADLVRRLTEAGIQVVPPEELRANSEMSRLRPLGTKAKGQNDWTVFGAAAAPLYAGHPLSNSPMGAPGANIALTDVSFDLNAVILQPYLAIDYARYETTGQRQYVGSAIVSSEVRFRVPSAGANFFQGPSRGKGSGPYGTVQTQQSTGTDEQFAVMFKIDDKSDDPAINNTFARLGLGSLYRQSIYYGVEVAPDRYAALVRAAYQGLNAAIVAEVVKARG